MPELPTNLSAFVLVATAQDALDGRRWFRPIDRIKRKAHANALIKVAVLLEVGAI